METETAEKPDVADTLEETELAAVEEVAEVVESIEEDTTDGAEEEADKPADAE
ncbi:hypothetical protein HQ531_00590 [bacterium]|nr:hypothetical protein [bacterium]